MKPIVVTMTFIARLYSRICYNTRVLVAEEKGNWKEWRGTSTYLHHRAAKRPIANDHNKKWLSSDGFTTQKNADNKYHHVATKTIISCDGFFFTISSF